MEEQKKSIWTESELEYVRKFANARTAKNKGKIDLKDLLNDYWGKYSDPEDYV